MKRFIAILLVMLSIFGLSSCLGGMEFELNFIVDGETYNTVKTSGNDIIKVPANPIKDGFTFDGWYWDEGVWEKPFTANSLLDAPISGNMSVYAKWKENAGTHTHITSDWITDTEATCKAAGTKHKECTECEEVLEIGTTEKLTTHTPAEALTENFVDSDCETEGSYNLVVYCSVCEAKISTEAKIVEKKDHTPSDWIEDTPATCKAAGTKHKECTECEEVLETGTIEKLTTHREGTKHVEIEEGLFCGNSGEYYATVHCLDCGEIISSENYELPEKHKMSNGVCEICGLPQSSTKGMYFYLKSDGTYLVSTSSKAIDENVVIGVYNDITVTEINGGAFMDRTDIKSITIADCVTTIGDLAFYNCTSLKTVIIGNGVREIPDETFFGCTSLRSVTLGDNVETIGYRAFKGCSKLYYVYITGAYDWKLRSEHGNTTTVYGNWIAKEDDRQYYGAYYLLEYVAYKWTRK